MPVTIWMASMKVRMRAEAYQKFKFRGVGNVVIVSFASRRIGRRVSSQRVKAVFGS